MIEKSKRFEVIIVGGGLAGLVSAMHLSQKRKQVLLIEKHKYPKHKVCGEYISNEVLPYLGSLDLDPNKWGAHSINKFMLSTVGGKVIESDLPLGGFGISRFRLDHALAEQAIKDGVTILYDRVTDINFEKDQFYISTKENNTYQAPIAIGAYGKRSNLDHKLNRSFIDNPSPYLAVKAHYQGEFPDGLVSLHNFQGGYCGISKVENDMVNVCYIADYESFKKYKNINRYQQKVLSTNQYLKSFFEKSTLLFEKPLAISQISFAQKSPVKNHIIMCGDTAGMIHPLCGNGMGMAIHAAKIASELILKFLDKKIEDRAQFELMYKDEWNKNFKHRLKVGRGLAKLLRMNNMSYLIMLGLGTFPSILPQVIKRTHGQPLKPMAV